jgi:hypothetical protein
MVHRVTRDFVTGGGEIVQLGASHMSGRVDGPGIDVERSFEPVLLENRSTRHLVINPIIEGE